MLIKIDSVKIGPRFRKDLGDIRGLVRSIQRLGQLVPIGVSEDLHLIHGRRRLAAFQKLGFSKIEACVLKCSSRAFSATEAEVDENVLREPFTNYEIAEIDQYFRAKMEVEAKIRQKKGTKTKANLGENFTKDKGRSASKIAAMVGMTDRTLVKMRDVVEAAPQGPEFAEIWRAVGQNKMSIDQGHKRVNDLMTIKAAELEAEKSGLIFSAETYDLKLGSMQEKGLEIPDSSIDMIFTDPPYKQEHLALYDELAKLAQRVLKPGGSLCTYVGHYALQIIMDKIRANSDLKYAWMFVAKHNGRSTIIWNIEVWPGYKPILWYYKPDAKGKPSKFDNVADLIKNDFIESQPVNKTFHKWEQSPIEAEHLIKPLTVRGQAILDPFLGYGTTGVAALKLNRKFIGIENDKVSYSRAAQRLTNFFNGSTS